MKRLFIFLISISSCAFTFAQESPPPSQYLKTVNSQFLMDIRDSSVWQNKGTGPNGTVYGWERIGRYKDIIAAGKFTFNIPVIGTSIGPYNSGDTIKASNSNLQQILTSLVQKVVHPIYTSPTASISASPGAQSYEYGTSIGTVTLSSVFNPNDAGSSGTRTYYKAVNGGSYAALGSNADAISNITQTVQYYVNIGYSSGACKPNNMGQTDCTGSIQAGSVNSGVISFTSYHKRYLGFASSALNGDGTPADTDVRAALYQDNSGGNTQFTGYTLAQQTADKYLFIVTTSPVSSISINGFPSTASFNMNIIRTFVNAAGGSYTYYFCVSKNQIGSTGQTSFTSN